MDESLTPSDADALLAQLRAAAAVADAPPEHVLEAARAAFELRDLDAQLASLVSDSAETGNAVLLRDAVGDSAYRVVVFEAGQVSVELEVAATSSGRRLIGVVSGGAAGELTVQYADGTRVDGEVDDIGRFALDVPAGLARLRLLGSDGTTVVTAFLDL